MDTRPLLRKLLPRRAISAARLLSVFQRGHGHLREEDGLILDGNGNYQPWLTYPLIEYLKGLDASNCRVFEYGAGASTLFWAARAREVVSVEWDRAWSERLAPKLPANARVILESDDDRYPRAIGGAGDTFDIIVIDGAERHRCAENAIAALRSGGMIILDNSEWYPNTSALLASHDLIEVRFSGFGPLNAFASTSAVFFHRAFALKTNANGRRPPVGGNALPAPAPDDAPGPQRMSRGEIG